jgi:hypothetical protein
METQNELWNETKTRDHFEILGALIRQDLAKESVRHIDLSYLGNHINRWWIENRNTVITRATHSSLRALILESIKPGHLDCIQAVGSWRARISAVLLEHVFSEPDQGLARIVHETMSEIAGIVDIKYPYEDHKELFPKENDGLASDWGKGLGLIRPHSDDLYEDRAINAMCLTVCKDTSSTPTWFWALKDIIACLTDEELGRFALAEATFLSGKNVEGKTIIVRKAVLRMDPEEGLGMRIDFRIDDAVGPRMCFADAEVTRIFEKMRAALRNVKPIATNPSTGSISILANYKVLHGRSALNPVMLYEGESSRVLFRSKGIK